MSETTSYEQARDELVVTVQKLEAGGIPLEESIALWERGEELARICQQWLDGARARLDKVMAESGTAHDDDRRRVSRLGSVRAERLGELVSSSSDAVPVTTVVTPGSAEHESRLVVLGELLPLDPVDRHRVGRLVGPRRLLDERRRLSVALLQTDVLAVVVGARSASPGATSTRALGLGEVGARHPPALRHRRRGQNLERSCALRASASCAE